LGLVLTHVPLDGEALAAGHDDVLAVELRAQAEALEHEPDHVEVRGAARLDAQLAPVTPASA